MFLACSGYIIAVLLLLLLLNTALYNTLFISYKYIYIYTNRYVVGCSWWMKNNLFALIKFVSINKYFTQQNITILCAIWIHLRELCICYMIL